ncbi:MAG: SAM-dependent methyltransferase [Nitrososphaerota archaeon]|jgi:precorrin-6B methylase 2|nr:SAM-dependent methyltransferase [Nitrososphaerota archaeon]MDG7041612.1 SAM-dependent methyltransferase [Nitrososphaerota archaeon]MDG7046077.1 SAM-dependent methyltransferase [Nitrososphaerota archaeon]
MGGVFFPSPPEVINEMLAMAGANSTSVVYDLGSGDGSIVMAAARDYNVRKAVGIERDGRLCSIARARAARFNNVVIINADYDAIEISEASIVTVYQGASENSRLRPKFLRELRNGSMIVSHEFGIPGWRPTQFHIMKHNGRSYRIMVYVVGSHTP